jgi:hypothetical protein
MASTESSPLDEAPFQERRCRSQTDGGHCAPPFLPLIAGRRLPRRLRGCYDGETCHRGSSSRDTGCASRLASRSTISRVMRGFSKAVFPYAKLRLCSSFSIADIFTLRPSSTRRLSSSPIITSTDSQTEHSILSHDKYQSPPVFAARFFRFAKVRKRSALSLMKPAASWWS